MINVKFTAAQAAQKNVLEEITLDRVFTAAQAAQKTRHARGVRPFTFTAAQAAQKFKASIKADGVQFIILDGPPVLGLADAVVLGNQVPSVLYVAQASQTRKSHIKDAFRRLRMAGIVPRGVVLTKTTAQNTAYYTYDNYYGYGADQAPGSDKGPKTEPMLRRA